MESVSFYLHALWENDVLVSSVLAWLIAQIIKIFLFAMTHKKWDIERLVGSGGMPSSHSALVTALCTSIGILDGMNSEIFALACVFAAIVMYDAAGVRRAAGEQARILNSLLEEFDRGEGVSRAKLRELLGHTPIEVLAGAVLGIAVSYCYYVIV